MFVEISFLRLVKLFNIILKSTPLCDCIYFLLIYIINLY